MRSKMIGAAIGASMLVFGAVQSAHASGAAVQVCPDGSVATAVCPFGVKEKGCRPEAYVLCTNVGNIFGF